VDSTDIGDGDLEKLSADGAGGGGTTHEEIGRLGECKDVLESILQSSETSGIPLLVLANKQDREDCVEVVRIKEGFVRRVFEGEKGGSVRDSRVLPCSALTGTGVEEAVEWVRTRVEWNKESRPAVMR
jgi:ADP-ribosylation factor related protein 1